MCSPMLLRRRGPRRPPRNLPQHGWRGQSPRSKPARTPRSSRRRFGPLPPPPPRLDYHDVLAHAASSEGAQTAPSKPPPTRLARAKPALETSANSKILETTIRSPAPPPPAPRLSRCARPCCFVGGGPDGPLETSPNTAGAGKARARNQRELQDPRDDDSVPCPPPPRA